MIGHFQFSNKNLYSHPKYPRQARDFIPDQGKFLQAGCQYRF
ncbi:hypothetical protein ANACOL_00644 [Anaerotruncus colihominis DSM 17241]|uniref:Uncharacterized protein n=1 Tax=Anaerotruncus colihominis DSM 17241 TaxID=445972 RepID=B0P7B4_9FIRM|nr:hypothetical protein ANACOL_00644 [Anaerotruncus colihominis DSM 17241]